MSKLRIMDHFKPVEDRLCCNLCHESYPKKNSESTYASLWYHLKTKHAIERPIWSDASKIPPAKRTKIQSSLFFVPPWWEEEPEYGLCCAHCSALLIFQLNFYQQFHPEFNATEIQLMSFILLIRPSMQRWRSFGRLQKKRL